MRQEIPAERQILPVSAGKNFHSGRHVVGS